MLEKRSPWNRENVLSGDSYTGGQVQGEPQEMMAEATFLNCKVACPSKG